MYAHCVRMHCIAICSTKCMHKSAKSCPDEQESRRRRRRGLTPSVAWTGRNMRALDKINEKGFKTHNLLWLKRVDSIYLYTFRLKQTHIIYIYGFPIQNKWFLSLSLSHRSIFAADTLLRMHSFCGVCFINKCVNPLTKSHWIWNRAINKLICIENCDFAWRSALIVLAIVVVNDQMKLICGN